MTLDFSKLQGLKTPVYVYDRALLEATLQEIKSCIEGKPVMVHYAVKANCNPEIMKMIAGAGFGADCVSGGEIKAAVAAGFAPESICYAGVGKTDDEILTGVKAGIGFFNVESIEELEILNAVAKEEGAVINVALRVNPNIDAHTHLYITTGLEENKFGIDLRLLDKAIDTVASMSNLELCGLHFHIGSQITVMDPFVLLCEKINGLVEHYRKQGVEFKVIDVGGGLGIDYDNPDANPIPPFKAYFDTLLSHLHLGEGQTLHCELGRSIVGQCGSLLSRVTFVKEGIGKKFVILDAGMNDLMRPALYGAHHNIENLSAAARHGAEEEVYDVVGPICESSDIFGKEERLPATRRGDLIALRSAGAYGESMASTYNMRPLPASILL